MNRSDIERALSFLDLDRKAELIKIYDCGAPSSISEDDKVEFNGYEAELMHEKHGRRLIRIPIKGINYWLLVDNEKIDKRPSRGKEVSS